MWSRGCGTGAHQGSGAERGKAQHRRGQSQGTPGRGWRAPRGTHGQGGTWRGWVARGGHGDRYRTPLSRGGLRVTRTPSDPSRASGKDGSFQDPRHPQSFPSCQPSGSRCPHAGELARGSPPASLQGDQRSPLAHPGPRLWLRSSCCRAGTGRGAEAGGGSPRGQQFQEGWRGCWK